MKYLNLHIEVIDMVEDLRNKLKMNTITANCMVAMLDKILLIKLEVSRCIPDLQLLNVLTIMDNMIIQFVGNNITDTQKNKMLLILNNIY